jgi:hypothetical protein
MFDIDVYEVYSLNREVLDHGERTKKHRRNSCHVKMWSCYILPKRAEPAEFKHCF